MFSLTDTFGRTGSEISTLRTDSGESRPCPAHVSYGASWGRPLLRSMVLASGMLEAQTTTTSFDARFPALGGLLAAARYGNRARGARHREAAHARLCRTRAGATAGTVDLVNVPSRLAAVAHCRCRFRGMPVPRARSMSARASRACRVDAGERASRAQGRSRPALGGREARGDRHADDERRRSVGTVAASRGGEERSDDCGPLPLTKGTARCPRVSRWVRCARRERCVWRPAEPSYATDVIAMWPSWCRPAWPRGGFRKWAPALPWTRRHWSVSPTAACRPA
jgi:hypothetical protein